MLLETKDDWLYDEKMKWLISTLLRTLKELFISLNKKSSPWEETFITLSSVFI